MSGSCVHLQHGMCSEIRPGGTTTTNSHLDIQHLFTEETNDDEEESRPGNCAQGSSEVTRQSTCCGGMNPAYHQPVGCIILGLVFAIFGFSCLFAFYPQRQVQVGGNWQSVAVPMACVIGGFSLVVGCCLCCSRRTNIQKNWDMCRRKQALHRVSIGSPEDRNSRQQPVISGYDPRMLAKLPNP